MLKKKPGSYSNETEYSFHSIVNQATDKYGSTTNLKQSFLMT